VKNEYRTEIRGLGPEWAGRVIVKKYISFVLVRHIHVLHHII
jgi:hypothetical protein